MKNSKKLLFSYGTLREPKIQKKVFGKEKKGTPDILEGYKKYRRIIENENCAVVLKKKGSFVRGKVYELSKKELKKADAYERELYLDRKLNLKSEKCARVYVGDVN